MNDYEETLLQLEAVNLRIERIIKSEEIREYYRRNPHKKAESNRKWDLKNRKEYTKKYKLKTKKNQNGNY